MLPAEAGDPAGVDGGAGEGVVEDAAGKGCVAEATHLGFDAAVVAAVVFNIEASGGGEFFGVDRHEGVGSGEFGKSTELGELTEEPRGLAVRSRESFGEINTKTH